MKKTSAINNAKVGAVAPKEIREFLFGLSAPAWPAMCFRIGIFIYTVYRQRNLTLDGEPIDGYCASTVRKILLDAQLEGDVLESTLRHEHTHAWQFEVGMSRTSEDQANFTSCVGSAFDVEFNAQGGLEALERLPVIPARKGTPQLCQRCRRIAARKRRALKGRAA